MERVETGSPEQAPCEFSQRKGLRIAQVSPLYESVPPLLYGGTERVVAYLCDALVDLGHEVTLFASGDSHTRATLHAGRERALRLDDAPCKSEVAAHLGMLHDLLSRADDFDIIHFHTDVLHFPVFASRAAQTVTTLHGRLDIADLAPVYRAWHQFPLISISNDQRRPLPHANWAATVHHGLPLVADAGEPGSKLWSLDPNSPAVTPGGGTSGSGGSSTGGNAAGGVTGGSQGQGGTNTGGTANGGTANGGATKGGNAAGGTSSGGSGGTAPGGASDGNSAGAGGAEAGSNNPGGGEAGSADSGQTSGGAITPRSGGSAGALSAGANSRGGATQTTGGTSQPGSSGGANSSSGASSDSSSGCSCRTTSKGQSALPWLALLALGITRSQRRRRR